MPQQSNRPLDVRHFHRKHRKDIYIYIYTYRANLLLKRRIRGNMPKNIFFCIHEQILRKNCMGFKICGCIKLRFHFV